MSLEEFFEEPVVKKSLEVVENEIEVDGVIYIEKTTYRVYSDGTKEVACSSKYPKPSDEPVEPQPTQLDNIEETQLVIMEALADQYEQKLEQDLVIMESQATIFEMLLEIGGTE